MLLGRLGLVQTRQSAIVTLVKTPVLDHRHIGQARRLQGQGAGALGARQDRGEHDRRLEPGLGDQLAAASRLGLALGRQVDIDPSGEAIFKIPLALAVAEQDQARHSVGPWRRSDRQTVPCGVGRRQKSVKVRRREGLSRRPCRHAHAGVTKRSCQTASSSPWPSAPPP